MVLPWILVLGGQAEAQTSAIEPVRQAELAFARLADEKDIRVAFLTWLRDDARVFTPRMTTAKEQYGPEPGDPGHLAWYPEAMGISASGDLAWSFGPWTYAMKKGEATLVHGHFLSVWRPQADGHWKVVADIGVPHAAPERPIEAFSGKAALPVTQKPDPKALDAAASLRQKETDLSAAWAKQGGLALLPELAKAAQVLRRRSLPLRGAEIGRALAADPPLAGGQAQIQVAASGDLAWACGEAGPDASGSTASYLRIWIVETGTWKVLFDVRLPIPPPKK
jgi:ketosteroid isomerase-like protein